MKEKIDKTVPGELKKLAVKGKVAFPYSRSNYIKSACVTYGRLWKRTFSIDTTTDRNKIIVTRKA